MKTAYSIVEILNELYNDNLSILMDQNHELLEKNQNLIHYLNHLLFQMKD